MYSIKFLLALIGCAALSATAHAQKSEADFRPLQGLENKHIPTIHSLEALLGRGTSVSLTDAATKVGAASFQENALGRRLAITGLAANRASKRGFTPADNLRVYRAGNGTVRWMEGSFGNDAKPFSAGKRTEDVVRAAREVLQAHARLMRLENPSDELTLASVETDELGFSHARFDQHYAGIPVWGSDLYVHLDATGSVYAVNGTYVPTPETIHLVPNLSEADVMRIVRSHLEAEGRWAPLSESAARWFGMDHQKPGLVLYPDPEMKIRLAYDVSIHANLIEWFNYIVDAETGQVLNRIAKHCTIHHAPGNMSFGNVSTTFAFESAGQASGSFVNASGFDLRGVSQTFRVFQNTGGTYFKVWDLPNLDVSNSKLPDEPSGGALTISANRQDMDKNEFFHVTSTNNSWTDSTSISAHVNMSLAYDYFSSTHGRGAIDGNDQSLISVVHITQGGEDVDNAFWNGRMMIYGNGKDVFTPLAAGLDVAGHEMSHGVIQHSANLIYQFQPGALNESFADVFGAMIDRENLLIGDGIIQEGKGTALRDMLNPGNPQVVSPQPAHMNQYQNLTAEQNNGGVHVNSGIPNRAAALLIQAIGHDKVERIYYRALTSYLTRNSQFGDARKAIEQSALDLFGNGMEYAAVAQSFDAVGITAGTGGEAPDNEVPALVGGRSLISVMLEDGTIGLIDVTDPNHIQGGVFNDPNAKARVAVELEDRSQLTSPRSGERIWFVNQDRQLAFIEVESGDVSVFPDLFIAQPGDLWNASIAPDEAYVALVSAYADDPTLYIFDGEQLGAIPLKPETTQDGIHSATIAYPDVISWSPNDGMPRIAFDAFNTVQFGGGGSSVGYWSIHEIDFSTGKIFDMLPAQPTTISAGNITYSSTNPDILAFNTIEMSSGIWDVVLADYERGALYALELPSVTLEGWPVTDAQRPTFSSDDSFLCMTSPELSILIFVDLNTAGLDYIGFDVPLFNPHWFSLGGTPVEVPDPVAVEPSLELPTELALRGNYPNPFNPTTTIKFELPAPLEVELSVFDLLGRRVAVLVEALLQEGAHDIRFDSQELPSGTYLIRLRAGDQVRTSKMVLVR